MINKVFKTVNEKDLLNKGDKVLVALSGGADSVSLLIVLQNSGMYDVSAVHVNHGIRGKEADRDEAFCKSLCEKLGVELYIKRVDVPKLAQEKKLSLETCAREVRYDFFDKLTDKFSFDAVATAHTAEDNAETVIMNIGRGAGLQGVCGIPFKRGKIIRPLLLTTKEEILEYLEKIGQDFVTDSTNFEADFVRNKIRLSVMPKIKEVYPDFTEAVAKMTETLNEDNGLLNAAAKEAFTRDAQKLNSFPPSVKKRVLTKICKDYFKVTPEKVHIDELCRLCREKKGISALPNGVFVTLKNGELAIFEGEKQRIDDVKITANERISFGNYILKSEIKIFDEEICRKINNSVSFTAFNCDIIKKDLTIGTRKSGDEIFISKRNLTKSVKKLFNECKIPPEKRDEIPVIYADDEVLWVYSCAKSGKYPPKIGEKALIISIKEKDFSYA